MLVCILTVVRERCRYDVAHGRHPQTVAQCQHILTADHVHGEPAVVDRQGPGPRSPVRVPGLHVHLLVDTRLLAGVVYHAEAETRRLDEKLNPVVAYRSLIINRCDIVYAHRCSVARVKADRRYIGSILYAQINVYSYYILYFRVDAFRS